MHGYYEYFIMFFGFTNVPAIFQIIINWKFILKSIQKSKDPKGSSDKVRKHEAEGPNGQRLCTKV